MIKQQDMKKSSFLFVAIMAMILAGCTAKQSVEEEANQITITAVMAENNPTRTVLLDGTTSVLWEPADEVKVFYKTTGSRFTSNNTEPAGQADFTGTLTVTGFFGDGFTTDTPLWAVYPYRADATSDGESVITTLPAEQTGRAGSFAKRTFITLAKSSNTQMGFYNVCGGVRFSLTQEGIKEVVFQGQNDEDLAGKVKLAFVDGLPAVQEITEGQKTITLTAPNNGTFETGQWYYIVAIPGTLSGGFKMTFNTETEYATLKSSKSVTIKRGIFGSLADADEDLIFKEKGEEPPVTGNIVFADPAAKFACVAKYDTDGDGEVSVEEAEAATTFEGLFTDWKGVTSFEEISYFKNVHSLNGVFNGCNKLVSLTVPDNITDLGTNAFNGCSLLTSVELPSGITSIGNYSFQNCAALGSVDIPSTVTSIGQEAFRGCTSLSSIDFPANLTAIGQRAFQGCTALAQIVIPDSVNSLGNYSFVGCSSLVTANIPSGISAIPTSCFYNCVSLTSVSVPEGITYIGNNAFYGVQMWKLELPSSITSLGNSCFGSIVCIILPSTSPITIQSNTFDGVEGIFVPSNMIDMYGIRTYWTNYASILHPIGSFKEMDEFTLATSGAVDMGTSVKWATCNIGASKPEEYGGYYAWGETETKANYSWFNYNWCNGDFNRLTKYCPADKADYWAGTGSPDGKTILDLEDDVVSVNWGGSWRMPSYEEWKELRDGCLWVFSVYNGINGFKIYSVQSSNMIFLPAAGGRYGSGVGGIGTLGGYWSSTLDKENPGYACRLELGYDGGFGSYRRERMDGFSVRPVSE